MFPLELAVLEVNLTIWSFDLALIPSKGGQDNMILLKCQCSRTNQWQNELSWLQDFYVSFRLWLTSTKCNYRTVNLGFTSLLVSDKESSSTLYRTASGQKIFVVGKLRNPYV